MSDIQNQTKTQPGMPHTQDDQQASTIGNLQNGVEGQNGGFTPQSQESTGQNGLDDLNADKSAA